MIIDARMIPSGTTVETDVCIVGAGAAGITIARALKDAPFRVALLESGGMEFDQETQDLYDGESIGLPFKDLRTSRLRFFGGTTNHWGGYCLPLDAIDFEPRDHFPFHGWPFSKSHLDPWYERAQEVCQLGRYDYRPSGWGIAPAQVKPPFAGPDFEMKLMQEHGIRFGPVYAPEFNTAPRVTLYLYANAVHLDGGEAGTEIQSVLVKTLSARQFTVRARFYILAAGGLENARLILASGERSGNRLGNAQDLVGRFLMVHLAYSAGTVVPADPHQDFDFMASGRYSADTYRIHPVLGLTGQSMSERHLPSIMVGWEFQFSPVVGALEALKRLVGGMGPKRNPLKDLSKVIGDLEGITNFMTRKVLFGQGIPIEALHLWGASEQQPNPLSRVQLGSKRDQLDLPEIVVDWQLTAEDQSMAASTLRLLGTEIGRAGFGRLRTSFGENDAWPNDFVGTEHFMGTTRMHRDPVRGVVDESCRVHTIANLYVAGSSVFPTGGASNPTLTIVALALRLAAFIRMRFA